MNVFALSNNTRFVFFTFHGVLKQMQGKVMVSNTNNIAVGIGSFLEVLAFNVADATNCGCDMKQVERAAVILSQAMLDKECGTQVRAIMCAILNRDMIDTKLLHFVSGDGNIVSSAVIDDIMLRVLENITG